MYDPFITPPRISRAVAAIAIAPAGQIGDRASSSGSMPQPSRIRLQAISGFVRSSQAPRRGVVASENVLGRTSAMKTHWV